MKKYKNNTSTRLLPKEAEECFPWLKQCLFSGGTFYTRPNGERVPMLVYENGIWFKGDFKGIEMTNCEFRSGKFSNKMGIFSYGTWCDGIFEGFKIYKSQWLTGTVRHGYFSNSDFYGGYFEYGIFEDSKWYNGKWGENSHARLKIGKKGRYKRYMKLPNRMKVKKKRGKKSVIASTKNSSNIISKLEILSAMENKSKRKTRSDKGKKRKQK